VRSVAMALYWAQRLHRAERGSNLAQGESVILHCR
jgi:hypothetical protein